MLTACEPAPQTLTLTGGLSTGADVVTRFLPPQGTLSVSNALDGWVENAAYTGDLEKRVYLLSLPLSGIGLAGTTPGIRTLALPLPVASLGTSSTDLTPETGTWRGARAYDIGLCSQHISWSEFAQQLTEGIVGKLAERPTEIRNPRHVGVAESFPILRGLETSELDRVGFQMSFFADTIIGDAICPLPGWCSKGGCRGVRVRLSFQMVLGTTPGAYVRPEQDLDALAEELANWSFSLLHPAYDRLTLIEQELVADYRPCGGLYEVACPTAEDLDALLGPKWCRRIALGEPIPNANDPTVVIQNLAVSVVTDHCFGGGSTAALQKNLTGTFTDELSTGLAPALRDALLQPALMFLREDLPIRSCSCDSECTQGATDATNPFGEDSGPRHRCVSGRCAFQLELDRFEVRPEGLEIVLAEDDSDPQAAVLTDPGRIIGAAGMCNEDRGRASDRNIAVPSLLASGTFTAPTP